MNRYGRGYSTQSFGQSRTDCLDSRSYVRSKRKDSGGYKSKKKCSCLDMISGQQGQPQQQSRAEKETGNNHAHHFFMIGLCKKHQNAMFNALSPKGKQTCSEGTIRKNAKATQAVAECASKTRPHTPNL